MFRGNYRCQDPYCSKIANFSYPTSKYSVHSALAVEGDFVGYLPQMFGDKETRMMGLGCMSEVKTI